MSRTRALIWSSGIIGAAVLCYFFPLFRLKRINDTRDIKQGLLQSPVDVTEFANEFWEIQLRDAFVDAVDIEKLFEAIDRDPGEARDKFGRQVGLGGACFFFVRGAGHIEEVAADHCVVRIGERSRRACIHTHVIVGNAVRDSTGLIDVDQFANSQDFNRLSAELNQRVETHVIGPSRERLRGGTRVTFVGCAQVDDDSNFDPLWMVPVELTVEEPRVGP